MLPRSLMRQASRFFLFLHCLLHLTFAISIDNDLIGEPDIECLDEEIRVWVKTRKPFAGRIYAKNKADDADCYKDDFHKERTNKPHFDMKFGICGMKSLRSVDPRGMYYGITVVVSFHPLFITKVDQAFHVKCFFEEASRGLTAELGVSHIPTKEVEARHGIPGCSYSIHKSTIEDLDAGRPAGNPVLYARIGDKVLHQWHCNDQMFGILLHSCYVTDGFGKKADVIDEQGCPTNPLLITGIRYSADLQRAYAESQVFKFADKPGVWFYCQVRMCMKKHDMCRDVTPPACGSKAPELPVSERITTDNADYHTPNEEPDYDNNGAQTSPSRGGKRPQIQSQDYEDYDVKPTKPISSGIKKKKKPSTQLPDYEDYDAAANTKLHSVGSNPYSGTSSGTTSIDYRNGETTTQVFGPPAVSDGTSRKALGGVTATTIDSITVSETFETDDDLKTNRVNTKNPGRNDYNDFEDVTLPPNLTDLLANLPDDISEDSLQKMLRDSVIDKKALMDSFDMLKKEMAQKESVHVINPHSKKVAGRPGDKINQVQIDWMSARHRDQPIPEDSGEKVGAKFRRTVDALRQKNESEEEQPPMISGQLMIFEIDETPPPTDDEINKQHQEKSTILSSSDDVIDAECAISRNGLFAVAGGLGTVTATLFIIALTLFVKLRHINKDKEDDSTTPRQQLTAQEIFGRERMARRHEY